MKGLESILAAMNKFVDYRLLQSNALKALYYMTRNDDIIAKTVVANVESLAAILRAMSGFWRKERVVMYGCMLLASLCRVRELRSTLFNANALSIVAKARDTYKENDDISDSLITFMNALNQHSHSQSI